MVHLGGGGGGGWLNLILVISLRPTIKNISCSLQG